MTSPATRRAIDVFAAHGGIMRTSEAIEAGINPWTLYQMRDDGLLRTLSRGVYQLTKANPISSHDLISVQKRLPGGVICLISSLHIHEITLQVPHQIYIAVNRLVTTRLPKIDHPPTRVLRFVPSVFEAGQETMDIDGFKITVFSPEKTIADCFKHRNKIGLDVAIEALKLYRERKKVRVDKLLEYARVCRVEKIIKPYLEAIL